MASKAQRQTQPVPVNPKLGTTKTGTPRQRAYRTYYGLSTAGLMIRYKSYEERELAVRNEGVTRLTAHEVRSKEVEGEQAMTPQAARALTPRSALSMPVSMFIKANPSTGGQPVPAPSGQASPTGGQSVTQARQLYEAQLLLQQATTLLNTVKDRLDTL